MGLAARPGRNYLVYERIKAGDSYTRIARDFGIPNGRVTQIKRWVEMKMAREPRRNFAQADETLGVL